MPSPPPPHPTRSTLALSFLGCSLCSLRKSKKPEGPCKTLPELAVTLGLTTSLKGEKEQYSYLNNLNGILLVAAPCDDCEVAQRLHGEQLARQNFPMGKLASFLRLIIGETEDHSAILSSKKTNTVNSILLPKICMYLHPQWTFNITFYLFGRIFLFLFLSYFSFLFPFLYFLCK